MSGTQGSGDGLGGDLDDIVGEFLVESAENLDRLDVELVELEERPDAAPLIASIFRNIHTIKGTSGFFEFSILERVAHGAENLLSLLRDGVMPVDREIIDALLATVDALRSMLETIAATGGDGQEEHAELVARLEALAAGERGTAVTPTEVDPTDADLLDTDPLGADAMDVAPTDPDPVDTDPIDADPIDTPLAAGPAPLRAAETIDDLGPVGGSPTDASIRVDVALLDRLMNLVGELVLARNQVLQHQHQNANTDVAMQSTAQQLDLITTELQESVMQTRMQPIGNVWAKLPRVVRDLAATCRKQVKVHMEGEDTELDKTLIEAIKDPLTHIVRNSVDHGLETPDERRAAGKPETGTLRLRARHEGGQVIIEISDDGAGLDHDRIREKAVALGLVSAERAQHLSEREVASLIFRPGFSTAAKVTNVSGRGVGMDVVRTNVEKLGGTIEVASVRGEGTTLTVKIPLTLAIVPALIVEVDGDRYLIPQINLVEVLQVDGASGESRLEQVADAPVLRLRGNLLPVVFLREILGLDAAPEQAAGTSIVVLDADGFQFGLVVDRINDTEEIVVKPLCPHIKQIDCFAGTTIMGDGAVALILDALGLARSLGISWDERESLTGGDDDTDERRRSTTVLVCQVGTERIAIPLGLISRLEEVPVADVERAGGFDVLQYRGRLLRLISLSDVLGRSGPDGSSTSDAAVGDPETLQVLVHDSDRGHVGLVVDGIEDVFEAPEAAGDEAHRLAVIGNRVTDQLDLERILAHLDRRAELVGAGTGSNS